MLHSHQWLCRFSSTTYLIHLPLSRKGIFCFHSQSQLFIILLGYTIFIYLIRRFEFYLHSEGLQQQTWRYLHTELPETSASEWCSETWQRTCQYYGREVTADKNFGCFTDLRSGPFLSLVKKNVVCMITLLVVKLEPLISLHSHWLSLCHVQQVTVFIMKEDVRSE